MRHFTIYHADHSEYRKDSFDTYVRWDVVAADHLAACRAFGKAFPNRHLRSINYRYRWMNWYHNMLESMRTDTPQWMMGGVFFGVFVMSTVMTTTEKDQAVVLIGAAIVGITVAGVCRGSGGGSRSNH